MSAFGTSPLVTVGADPVGAPSDDIDFGAFWPTISVTDFRSAMRLDGSVTDVRLRAALIEAGISILDELGPWRLTQIEAGKNTLEETSAAKVDGEAANIHRFRRALFSLAAANIAERYRSIDHTAAGAQRAELIETPIDDLRRDAAWALSDIVARPRSTVELI